MTIIRSSDLQFIPASHEDPQNPGVWKKILFKKADLPEGRIQMINWSKLPPGHSFQSHYHEELDEIFIILNGKTEIKVDSQKAQLQKGDAVFVPTWQIHTMKNISNEEVYYLALGISHGKNGKTIIVK